MNGRGHIIETGVSLDQIHTLVQTPPKLAVSGVSEGNWQYDAVRIVWRVNVQVLEQRVLVRRYYMDVTGKDADRIQEYIKNQLREDNLGA